MKPLPKFRTTDFSLASVTVTRTSTIAVRDVLYTVRPRDIVGTVLEPLELPIDLNLAQLHEVLQATFGWTDSHLHQFDNGGLT